MNKEKTERTTPLKKIESVRAEMSRVYWAARNGKIEVNAGSKLIYMLKTIGDTIKDDDLEKRIEALEKEAGKK